MLIAILGAGRASRFGGGKLEAACAGKPLGRWSLEAARATGHPVAWIGDGPRPAFLDADCTFLHNAQAHEGLGRSVGVAATHAAGRNARALMILLADMPLVTPGLLADLVRAGPYAACEHRGRRGGVPALFPAAMFPQLAALTGDRGASALLGQAPFPRLLRAPASSLIDIDTSEDIARAEAAFAARGHPF